MKPHGTFIQGEVVALTDSSATLADDTQLQFDYAAIATGSSYAVGKSSTAVTLQQRLQELQVGPPTHTAQRHFFLSLHVHML
jgi:hypothetical protein